MPSLEALPEDPSVGVLSEMALDYYGFCGFLDAILVMANHPDVPSSTYHSQVGSSVPAHEPNKFS